MEVNRQSEVFVSSDEYGENDSIQNTSLSFFLHNTSVSSDDELDNFDDQNFNLNYRQKLVVEWMITKEMQEPYGGIIATDMGNIISKITVIMGLLFKSRVPSSVNTQSEGETDLDETYIQTGHTLIVCSKNTINEWIECVEKNSISKMLNICVYDGRQNDLSLHGLCQNDIVITTITLVQKNYRHKNDDLLYIIKWNRIILDDALIARNHKLQKSKALCQLSGICRWAFMGSEFVDDDDEDTYYSIMKYIKHKSLGNLKKWKEWLKRNPAVTVKGKLKHIVYNKRII